MDNNERKIFIMAWNHWNWDISIPKEYEKEVAAFINENPEMFGSATPQQRRAGRISLRKYDTKFIEKSLTSSRKYDILYLSSEGCPQVR